MVREQVSLTTASRVFQTLEEEGKVYARYRSGYFVRPQSTSAQVSLPPLTEEATYSPMRHGGPKDTGGTLRNLINRILKRIASDTTKNHLAAVPENGLRELRCGVARIMDDRRVTCGPDDLVITPSSPATIELALRAVARPGDTVAIEKASHLIYQDVFEMLRLNVVEVASAATSGIDLQDLNRIMQAQKINVIVSRLTVQHALGRTIPSHYHYRKALMTLIEHKDIVLIEDDPFHDVYAGPERLPTLKSLDRHGQVVYCSSFAPIVGDGYQIGWCLAGKYAERMIRNIRERGIFGNALPQLVLSEFLRKGHYATHVDALRAAAEMPSAAPA